jgi:hypothetical protein
LLVSFAAGVTLSLPTSASAWHPGRVGDVGDLGVRRSAGRTHRSAGEREGRGTHCGGE